MSRRDLVKDALWILFTAGLVAAVIRFSRGLGATTNLNDATPWGLWIGFDVIAGVALAAGGFTLAATVYIFHLEKYRPLLRPAILTAFLGYVAVIVGLLVDLGLPWNIWRPTVYWQHHSVLFEVAWCVMLYTAVLGLEFLPSALEHPMFKSQVFQTIVHWLKRLTLPLVIAGIVLSTLHQSSLGSLLLIVPFRVHELWYSPILPVLFFVSAAALGLMMVTVEGFFSAFVYRRRIELELFSGLGKAAAVILWALLCIRIGDLVWRGVLPGAIDGSWQSVLFLVEISISTLIPAILLSIPASRNSLHGLGTASVLTVSGMILHRLSASVIAVERPAGASYFPSWVEFAISIGIVSGAALIFLFFTENLKIFGPETMDEEEKFSPYARPRFDPLTNVRLGETFRDTFVRRSAVLIVVVALAITFMPQRAWTADQTERAAVRPVQGLNVLRISGSGNEGFVDFDHEAHVERQGELVPTEYATEQDMCVRCHHLSNWEIDGVSEPEIDGASESETGFGPPSCGACHSDTYSPTSTFDHDLHEELVEPGGNKSCDKCHEGGHSADTAVQCVECHKNMGPSEDGRPFDYVARSYVDAMHGLCIECHEAEAQKLDKPLLPSCVICHGED
jgi:Ni/Fe-hydrogenase subunit HybB-like protein